MSEKQSDRSLFVVGDDAQSIYAFRGSKIEIILGLHKTYPKTKEVVLNQNYRSNQNILDLAEKVLSHNPNQKQKDLFTDNPESVHVKYYEAYNQDDEAEYIVRSIENLYVNKYDLTEPEEEEVNVIDTVSNQFDDAAKSDNEVKFVSEDEGYTDFVSDMFDNFLDKTPSAPSYNPNSWSPKLTDWNSVPELNKCAILYRTHAQSRAIEEIFLRRNVPYKLVSGTRFLDRKEIKDVLAILKFVSNTEDIIALSRFLPLITMGIGPKTLQKVAQKLKGQEVDLAPRVASQVDRILTVIKDLKNKHTKLIDFSKDLFDYVGYLEFLKNNCESTPEFMSRMENIQELYSLMLRHDENQDASLDVKVNDFLNQITLMTNQDDELADVPKVSLMSLHQSKGLEYETVFLVGVEDNLLPHSNSYMEPNGMEEEVRLSYVGVTRAKKNLFLTNAKSRIFYGNVQSNLPSRIFRPFLKEHAIQEYK